MAKHSKLYLWAVVIAAALLVTLGVSTGKGYSTTTPKPTGVTTDSGGVQTRHIGGVLRNTNGTWSILNDATHTSLNLTSVTADSTAVHLFYPNSSKMLDFNATVDETYAQMGIALGASVVTNEATIKFSQVVGGKVVPLNPLTLITTYGNVWISADFWV